MEFAELVRQHAKKVMQNKDKVKRGETFTLDILIKPFFGNVLGFDITNPDVARSEFPLAKNRYYVDMVLSAAGKPAILIEAKESGSTLNNNHYEQLQMYYMLSRTGEIKSARLAVLTNGVKYHFYTDLDERNIMDNEPFITVDFSNVKDRDIEFLELIRADTFNIDAVRKAADNIRTEGRIRASVAENLSKPSDDIVRLIIRDVRKWGSAGVSAKRVAEYRPAVSRAISDYIKGYIELEPEAEKPPHGKRQFKKWDKKQFMTQAAEVGDAESVKLCERLLQSAGELGCETTWGTGKSHGSFSAVYSGKQRHSVYRVTNGSSKVVVEFPFGSIRQPLNTDEYKQGLKSALERIDGVKIKDSDLGKYPSFDISSLNNEKAYKQFTDTMAKYIEDIKAAEAKL